MRSNSVTRKVIFNRTKIGEKCQNSKIQCSAKKNSGKSKNCKKKTYDNKLVIWLETIEWEEHCFDINREKSHAQKDNQVEFHLASLIPIVKLTFDESESSYKSFQIGLLMRVSNLTTHVTTLHVSLQLQSTYDVCNDISNNFGAKITFFRLPRLPMIFFHLTEFWADYMPRIKLPNSFKTFYNWKEFLELWIRLLVCLSTWLNPDGQLWILGILMRVPLQLQFYYKNQINVRL